jgi:hypothetical protein
MYRIRLWSLVPWLALAAIGVEQDQKMIEAGADIIWTHFNDAVPRGSTAAGDIFAPGRALEPMGHAQFFVWLILSFARSAAAPNQNFGDHWTSRCKTK